MDPKDGSNGSYCRACFNAYSRERTAAGRRKPTTGTRSTCAKCGVTPKDGSHYSYCKACFAAYMATRYVPSPREPVPAEIISANARARGRRHYQRHREEIKRRLATPAAKAKARARWAKLDGEHQGVLARYGKQQQRCRERAIPFEEYIDPLVVLEREDGECGVCGVDVDPEAFEVDHVVPLIKGGRHSYSNVQVTHPACNRRKGTKVLV